MRGAVPPPPPAEITTAAEARLDINAAAVALRKALVHQCEAEIEKMCKARLNFAIVYVDIDRRDFIPVILDMYREGGWDVSAHEDTITFKLPAAP